MNLQPARAKPYRPLFRQFAESAAFALLFALPAAHAHNPHDAPAGAAMGAVPENDVAFHTIHRQKADEVEIRQDDEPPVVQFSPPPAGWDSLPQTAVTKMMRAIEKRANETGPKYPVTIMDDDSINLRRTNNVQTFRNRMYEVLNDRNISLRWNMKSDIATALGGLKGSTHRDPQAFRIDPDTYQESRNPLDENVDQKRICIVIPSVPDLSSRSFINKWIGEKTGANMMEAKVDPGAYAMTLRTVWHEVWHCLDSHFMEDGYFIKGESALDNAQRMHRAEVFAEVAAVLTMAPDYPQIVQQMADIRAISSDYESRKTLPGMRASDSAYYVGVSYYLTRALDLVEDHIRRVGIDSVSRYSMEDISRIAKGITEQGALNKSELHHMATNLLAGAPVSARVRLAKERMMQDTGVPIPPKPPRTVRSQTEDDYYTADKALQEIPDSEKQQVRAAVKDAAGSTIARGQLGEYGLIALMEDWRKKVQEEDPQARLYERKLYILSMMLAQGHLEKELEREINPARAAVTGTPVLPSSAPLQPLEFIDVPALPAVKTLDITQKSLKEDVVPPVKAPPMMVPKP